MRQRCDEMISVSQRQPFKGFDSICCIVVIDHAVAAKLEIYQNLQSSQGGKTASETAEPKILLKVALLYSFKISRGTWNAKSKAFFFSFFLSLLEVEEN